MLSVCCLAGGPPDRLAALLELLRPVAGEIVVAVDDRVARERLGRVEELADVLVAYPFVEPVERSLAWLHSLCHGDWVFRIDDDEVPSRALLAALAEPDERLTHAWFPRRWLWQGDWLTGDPWTPDWQLRLVKPNAARFPGRTHIPVHADGPHAYLEAPLYHLDLVVNTRAEREAKVRRYEHERPGLRLGGFSLNAAYYLPEVRDELPVAPLPADDASLIRHVHAAAPASAANPVQLRRATRAEIDAAWVEAPLREADYLARIELARPPSPVSGEVREIDVRVTNLGRAMWPGGPHGLPEVRLSYRWRGLEQLDEQLRTPLPHDVEPGDTVLVPLAFRSPDEPGAYELAVDVVHERQRWFGAEAVVEVTVRPRRQAVVLVGQPPGDADFDQRVDEVLTQIDASLEPILVGPKEDWLHDRFGAEARSEPPPHAQKVFVVPAGQRLDQLRLRRRARALQRGIRREQAVRGATHAARSAVSLLLSLGGFVDRIG
jgi:hypothetical protein